MVPIRTRNRLLWVCLCLVWLAGCSEIDQSKTQAAYFVPPTLAVTATSLPIASTPFAAAPPRATSEVNCSNLLAYIKDITIPDGSMVSPGESIDKRWLVENQGTCNWNFLYSLRLTGGDPLGAKTEQSLVPAIADSQSIIRITFTAPEKAGKYRSAWQAYTPDARPFGDPIYIEVEVIARVIPTPLS